MMSSPSVSTCPAAPAATRLGDEPGRIAALQRLEVLDTASEPTFDRIAGLVRTVLRVPMSAVTLVDAERQWFKARQGLASSETPRDISFCTHTVARAEPLVIADALADPRFADNPLVTGTPFLRAYAGVPLTTREGYNVGALCALDTAPHEFEPAEIAVLGQFADLVVGEMELRRIARLDALTNVLSRRGLLDEIEREIARCRRHGDAAALVMLDIDHFKVVNDTHGHPVGDRVLCEVARLTEATLRPFDVVGRLGGEEFAVLLPRTDAGEAGIVAERLRRVVAALDVAAGTVRVRVTASFGVAPLTPSILSADTWLAAADAPLYAAKRGGRDRVAFATIPPALAA